MHVDAWQRALLLTMLALWGLIGACTRSASRPETERSIPEVVALTLTAAPTLPPSPTRPPSATPQPSLTPSPSVTRAASSTTSAGPSATSAGPPLPTDDPRYGLNLAAPDVTDDFSQRLGWYEYSDRSAATIQWEPGGLRVIDHWADGFVWWSTSGQTASDFYAEITAEINTCEGADAYGFAARIGGSNYDRGYTLEFSCDGRYRMRKFISGAAPDVLVDWTQAASLDAGDGADNRFGLLARGEVLAAFANGELLTQLRDSFYVFGNFGVFTDAANTADLTATFRDFELWVLEE